MIRIFLCRAGRQGQTARALVVLPIDFPGKRPISWYGLFLDGFVEYTFILSPSTNSCLSIIQPTGKNKSHVHLQVIHQGSLAEPSPWMK